MSQQAWVCKKQEIANIVSSLWGHMSTFCILNPRKKKVLFTLQDQLYSLYDDVIATYNGRAWVVCVGGDKHCALVVRSSRQGQHGSCIVGMYRMRVGHEWLVRITMGLVQDFNWQCNRQPKIWWFERFEYIGNKLGIKCIALFIGLLHLCYLIA